MLKSNRNIKLKVQGMLYRSVPNSRENERRIDWFLQNVPPYADNNYAAWYFYKTGFIGHASTAIAIMTLDCRSKRMRQGLKSRLQCWNCAGRSANVGI